jgi:hypothetical protein
MSVDTEIAQALERMPEQLKQEVLHYAKYLIANYAEESETENTIQKKRRSGILKGTFVLPLPEDFPLHHQDPFDRMLIAQAINRSLAVVSAVVVCTALGNCG